ncbi:TIGR04222 domain-containing membrane protein [Pseudomonas sp. CGJS7]|uniref:TIGR04222 domain-containing membrane protein n=1 Tax=Pseudomonas sp. CGJS7 TaxID=3109348 RepID=UPI00300A3582
MNDSVESAQWTEAQHALWQRLRDYRFGGENPRPFLDRIAHVGQSSRETAETALEEYRRFCFLAVEAGHEVTPSEVIDKVWHAHMTDTRDYWLRFCPQVLKRDLHHAPSLGGQAEDARHQQQYRDTLDSYRRYFGEPPVEFWPPPRAPARPKRQANPRESRVRLLSPWASAPEGIGPFFWFFSLILALVYLLGAWVQATFNPLDWRGGGFLVLFIAAMPWAYSAGTAIKRTLRGPNRRTHAACDDPVELGFLAGGEERAADVALVELMQRDLLQLDYSDSAAVAASRRDPVWLRVDGSQNAQLPPLLRIAAEVAAREQTLGATLLALQRAYIPVAAQLRRNGWWLPAAREWRMRLAGSLPLLALSLLGVAKIGVGMFRDKPVGFLVVLTILTGFLTLGRLVRAQLRTRAGDWILHDASRGLIDGSIAQRTALMGTIGLVGTDCTEYHTLRTPVSSGSGGDSGSGSSGGGDGGGGGCGGGGGGGCGGCGGG